MNHINRTSNLRYATIREMHKNWRKTYKPAALVWSQTYSVVDYANSRTKDAHMTQLYLNPSIANQWFGVEMNNHVL